MLTAVQRRWILLAWYVLLFSVPREGTWLAPIPGALIVGLGIAGVLAPAVSRMVAAHPAKGSRLALCAALAAVASLIFANAYFSMYASARNADAQLPPESVEALDWIRANTPEDARLVVLAGSGVREWAPRLARRTVLNQHFGAEWEPDEARLIDELEVMLRGCADLADVHAAVEQVMGHGEFYVLAEADRLRSGAGTPPVPLWTNDAFRVELASGR